MGLSRRRGPVGMENLAEGELKMELRRLADAIAGGETSMDDAAAAEALDRASTVLSALREHKFGCQRKGGGVGASGNGTRSPISPQQRKPSPAAGKGAIPEHFLCPISSEIMKEPVVLATGEVWLDLITSVVDAFPSFRWCVQLEVVF